MIGVPQAITPALREHLSTYVLDESGALLFLGAKGGALRRSGFNTHTRWVDVVKEMEMPGLHFHDIRQTGNMLAAESGAGLKNLMARLGHDNVRAAMIYQQRDDRLAWAWFPSTQANHVDDQVAAAVAPALTAIWPDAGDRIRQEIDDFDRDLQTRTTRRSDDIPRTGWRDTHADYSYDGHNGLVVTARDTSVRRWPLGFGHYATTISSAFDDLLAGGYDCIYPHQQSCNRPQSNGYFRVALRSDQIVSAQFGIGSLIESGWQRHLLSEEFPHGLTFLTEVVRRPVTERIEQSRRSGTSFAGIVAGTVVIIDACRGAVDGDDLVAYFDIQIGAPLAAT
ncbi:tyrosine-type recombinase/integrase [Microtetraspora fusca]|uniref:Tyrosine-type recombinase/integrase n=1 Tax=Microtetraspora fusca TaxID=1997 RepID=A0ABW6V204_MICFU